MPAKVLVVDDSAFFRSRIRDILEQSPDLKVVGFADNGRAAIEQTRRLQPDVITMDYEMPLMDGITAVKTIMAQQPTPILMFSSLSYEGARVTLDALSAGALDYLPKNFESLAASQNEGARTLREHVLNLYRSRATVGAEQANAPDPDSEPQLQPPARAVAPVRASTPQNAASPKSAPRQPATEQPKSQRDTWTPPAVGMILIGASTGGPMLIQRLLMGLSPQFPLPIIVVQHMPGTFTAAFAERLNRECALSVRQAQDGDRLQAGQVLVAPGGSQLLVAPDGRRVCVRESRESILYSPSVDITFGSAARYLQAPSLAIVLTGMGSDGREGCRLLKSGRSTVWTQTLDSCVVAGMPAAVMQAGYSDEQFNIEQLINRLQRF